MLQQNLKMMRRMCGTMLLMAGAILLPFLAFGQAPNNALQFVANIPIPNWTTTGQNAAAFDALWFNPQNGVVYIADRINDGATAVDTKTWTVLGTSVPPGCGIQTASSPRRTNCRLSNGRRAVKALEREYFGGQAVARNPRSAGLLLFLRFSFDLRRKLTRVAKALPARAALFSASWCSRS